MEIKVPRRVSDILKTTVENRHGEKLGTVQDLMVGADGCLKYAILSHGGFLGIGDVLIPVPFDALMTAEKREQRCWTLISRPWKRPSVLRARHGPTSLRPNGKRKSIDTLRPMRLVQVTSNRRMGVFTKIGHRTFLVKGVSHGY